MSELFYCSDQHFYHNNVIKFCDQNGDRYRPFDTIDDMHETIVSNHNSVVGKRDTVYFLGDLTFKRQGFKFLNEMNGNKILILGNHDTFPLEEYKLYFSSIHSVLKKHNCVLTHVPVHPSQVDSRWKLNIHGHLHSLFVLNDKGEEDEKYYNVSMEVTGLTPVPFSLITEQRYEVLNR